MTAQLLALVLVLGAAGLMADFWERLGLLSLYIQILVLGSSAALCLLRPALNRLDPRLTAGLAWGVMLGVIAGVAWAIEGLIPADEGLLPADGLSGLRIRSLGIGAIVGALLLRYLYLHHLWRRQVEAEAEARFQGLQARIRPHFLFNSLNTIANVLHKDPALAEALLQDLADLLHASLAQERLSTLAEELELARHYLRLERQRLGHRLNIAWDLEDLPGEAPLPHLTLQPLVENAVYHGIQPSSNLGFIRIAGRFRRGRVNLSVRNSLPGADETGRSGAGNRMALDNVRQRLEALYPGLGRIVEARIEGDYQVRLVFPYPWREH